MKYQLCLRLHQNCDQDAPNNYSTRLVSSFKPLTSLQHLQCSGCFLSKVGILSYDLVVQCSHSLTGFTLTPQMVALFQETMEPSGPKAWLADGGLLGVGLESYSSAWLQPQALCFLVSATEEAAIQLTPAMGLLYCHGLSVPYLRCFREGQEKLTYYTKHTGHAHLTSSPLHHLPDGWS